MKKTLASANDELTLKDKTVRYSIAFSYTIIALLYPVRANEAQKQGTVLVVSVRVSSVGVYVCVCHFPRKS